MFTNEKKINDLFFYWLITSLILVFLIIIVGGLTRLTNSGLSITEWELIEGIFPPLNNSAWEFYFEQYKQIPQYQLLNFNMSLNEFKVIFYWEYIHRILARFIGLFFLIPLVYFYFSNKIKKDYLKICYVIFLLIILQGIIGWFMVKSGLVNNITVSHYRLSLHLSTAIIIISILFWLIRNINYKTHKIFFKFTNYNLPFLMFIIIIFAQIILGAFVSGLDAGKIYQTWPMMNGHYFPNDLSIINLKDIFNFDNHSLVQFYHRNLAYLIVLYALLLSIFIYKKKLSEMFKPLKIVIFFLLLQVLLGIYTLISGLDIYLASLHQNTSVLLDFSAINLYYFRVK